MSKSKWKQFDKKDKSLYGKYIVVVEEGCLPVTICPIDEMSYYDCDDEMQSYAGWDITHWRKLPKGPCGKRFKDV